MQRPARASWLFLQETLKKWLVTASGAVIKYADLHLVSMNFLGRRLSSSCRSLEGSPALIAVTQVAGGSTPVRENRFKWEEQASNMLKWYHVQGA